MEIKLPIEKLRENKLFVGTPMYGKKLPRFRVI